MDRFERALETISGRLAEEFGDDLVGLLFAGSAAYGTPMRNSDVDLFVLIRATWRQRRNVVVDGVEVEMFLNPVEQIRREIDEATRATVDMFARGRIAHDPTGAVAELVEQAKRVAARPAVEPEGAARYFVRYFPSDLVRDAEDLVEVDPVAAELMMAVALQAVVEAHWKVAGRTPPKPKRALAILRGEAPDAAALAERVLDGELPLERRAGLLRGLCDLVLAPVGGMFLEGETPQEELVFDAADGSQRREGSST